MLEEEVSSMLCPFFEDLEQEGIRRRFLTLGNKTQETTLARVPVCYRKAIKAVSYVQSITFVENQQKAWQARNFA